MSNIPKAPGSVVTAGVLLIVYGALNLICSVCGVADIAMTDADAHAMLVKEVPAYTALQIGETLSSLVVGVSMIMAGVGVLQLMPIARIGGYVLCVYEILNNILHGGYTVIFVFPVTERMLAEQALNNNPMPFDLGQATMGLMWTFFILGLLVTLAFCVPILFFLSTASARAAFAGEFQGEPPPEDRRGRYDDYDEDDRGDDPPREPGPQTPPDTGIRDRP